MDKDISKKAINLLNKKSTKIIKGRKALKEIFSRKEKNTKQVSVIIAAHNADLFINKCIDSVVKQSLPFKNIELIIVDDNSTDRTVEILREYTEQHSNITAVLLADNTGTAAMPRNIGIELSTTDKIMFLDSDDWLEENALSILVNKMNQDDVDLVIGKTINVEDNKQRVKAEFMTHQEVYKSLPFEIPYILYYTGPQSKLIRASIIKENDIRFPEMRYAEDKHFFINILLKINNVSITTHTICYLNRLTRNDSSLTKTTEVIDKRVNDLEVMKYFLRKKVPIEYEKQILKRLLEYDLISMCNKNAFINSSNKEKFILLIKDALNLLGDYSYDIIKTFNSSIYKVAARLLMENKNNEFIDLFKWWKSDVNKQIVIDNNIAYFNVKVFNDNNPFKFIPIDLFVRSLDAYVIDNRYVQKFEIYGDYKETVRYVLLRDRKVVNNDLKLPIEVENNIGQFSVSYNKLNSLDSALFSIFIRFDNHRLVQIKRLNKNQVTYDNREFTFYTTKFGNVGFSLKDKT